MHIDSEQRRHAIVTATVVALALSPALIASAGLFDGFMNIASADENAPSHNYTAQSMPLLTPDSLATATPGDYIATDAGAIIAASGPSGGVADISAPTEIQEKTAEGFVSTYTVESGDTVASIAKTYGISPNTIRWANGLTAKSTLKIGQTLTIFPIDGVQHKVLKGETLAGIAKKHKADATEIADYNGIEDGKVAIGDTIFIPDGEMPATPEPIKTKPKKSKLRELWDNTDVTGYFIKPLVHFRKSQGIHGHNGVDLAGHIGEPIHAVASGIVLVASVGGYGGGYGNYVVLKHPNGTQTLYGHMNSVGVSAGQHVDQGDVIGELGNSGRSTGPHLHIEVHGARNPF